MSTKKASSERQKQIKRAITFAGIVVTFLVCHTPRAAFQQYPLNWIYINQIIQKWFLKWYDTSSISLKITTSLKEIVESPLSRFIFDGYILINSGWFFKCLIKDTTTMPYDPPEMKYFEPVQESFALSLSHWASKYFQNGLKQNYFISNLMSPCQNLLLSQCKICPGSVHHHQLGIQLHSLHGHQWQVQGRVQEGPGKVFRVPQPACGYWQRRGNATYCHHRHNSDHICLIWTWEGLKQLSSYLW